MRHWLRWLVAAVVCAAAGAAQAAWHQASSRHFIVYADLEPAELRAYAERVERFDQAVRFVRKMKDPPLTDSGRLTIFLVNNLSAIERLAGAAGVAGFYVSRASGSYSFVPRKAGARGVRWDLDADAIFFHEYAHHLQLQHADVAVPAWVSEGFAEFFARTELRDDGSVVIGVPPAYRTWSLLEYGDLSLKEMLRGDTRLTDMEADQVYGRGWLLTHFLSFTPARRGQLDRYIAEIQGGIEPLAAAGSAFGDLTDLEREISRYFRQKKLPHLLIRSSELTTGPIEIRPLTPGEEAILFTHMRTKGVATKRTKRDIASDARKIALRYPSDAFVQTALAEAEFDAENYQAADAAADRALAADPRRLPALIQKARARMELARANSSAADWSAVRGLLLRANKADPEAAEPLALFFKTFQYAGTPPTKNAVDGLLYALALAPSDLLLRLTVVRYLVAEGRFAEARRYFAPFAYEIHSNRKWKSAKAKALEAIKSGDAAALTHVDELRKLVEGD